MRSVFAPTNPLPAPPSRFNMAAYVLAPTRNTPDKIALTVLGADRNEDQNWSYSALERAVLGVAGGLLASGGQPGDRVLLRLGNTVEFPLAYLGAIAAGMSPIPSSPQLTESEITGLARLTGPQLIIAADNVALPEDSDAQILSDGDLSQMKTAPAATYHMGDPNRPAYIVFTSGTSGKTKAVMHAHRAIWARRMMWDGWYGLTPDDRLLHAGAFNWTYTMGTGLMDPWSVGATALIIGSDTRSEELGDLLKRSKATLFAAAPGVFRQMLKSPLPDLPDLRHGLSAGEKLPQATLAKWREITGTNIFEAYGMSECSTFVSGSPDHPAPDQSLGHIQSGRHVAVLDAQGAPVAMGASGHMAIHQNDPGLMLGYLGDAPEAHLTGEWFVTSDTVSMSEDHAVYFHGRSGDMMNAGGFRVSPIEVETAMTKHPDVHEAACAEVLVKANASVIACFYVPEDIPVADDTLSKHAHALLAHYKCPRIFLPVSSLPRGNNNKLLRSELRAQFERGEFSSTFK